MNQYNLDELKLINRFLNEQAELAKANQKKYQKQGIELIGVDNEEAKTLLQVSSVNFRDAIAYEGLNGMVEAWMNEKNK